MAFFRTHIKQYQVFNTDTFRELLQKKKLQNKTFSDFISINTDIFRELLPNTTQL